MFFVLRRNQPSRRQRRADVRNGSGELRHASRAHEPADEVHVFH